MLTAFRRHRTLILGIAATVMLVYGAIYILEVPAREMLVILVACLIVLGGVILAALAFTALRALVRKLLDKNR